MNVGVFVSRAALASAITLLRSVEHVHVFDELKQAALVIDEQQDGVLGVDHPFVEGDHCGLPWKRGTR